MSAASQVTPDCVSGDTIPRCEGDRRMNSQAQISGPVCGEEVTRDAGPEVAAA